MMAFASAGSIGAPKALIILVTSASQNLRRHERRIGADVVAAVARALADRGDLHLLEAALQFAHAELERARGAVAADAKRPRIDVDRRGNIGEMIADEERLVRRDRRGEIRRGRLVVRRAVAELDERLLSGQRLERRRVVDARWQAG